jgi:hypothetical protein
MFFIKCIVTGFDVDAACAVIFIVCIFYTAIVSYVCLHFRFRFLSFYFCSTIFRVALKQ